MVGPSLNNYNPLILKFLCSYGGKILPRHPDGKLRYHGGQTRVLAFDRSISFAELLAKLGELCGSSVSLRCQLPMEDLDALVSITSDEDLANIIEEYDRASSPPSSLKIRAFLSIPKKISPPSTASTSPKFVSSSHTADGNGYYCNSRFLPVVVAYRCIRHGHIPKPVGLSVLYENSTGKLPYYVNGNYSLIYLTKNGNHRR